MNKEQFTSTLLRASGQELNQDSIDSYWEIYRMLPDEQNKLMLTGDAYHTASHLYDWKMIGTCFTPIWNNGSLKGMRITWFKVV